MTVRITMFRVLARRRKWTTLAAFTTQWDRACREVAEREGSPRLRHLPLSERTFNRWILGELKGLPRPDAQRVLEHLFGVSAEFLFSEPSSRSAAEASRPTAVTAGGSSEGTPWPSPGEILGQARAVLAPTLEPGLLTLARESISSVIARYESLGFQPLAGEVRLLRRMLHVLLGSQHSPGQRRELLTLTGRTSGLLAYMAVNAGHPQTAAAYCAEAFAMAESAEDTDLMMWVLGTQSFGLYYSGRYQEADAAAEAGVRLDPSSPQAIRLLANGRARALARIGDFDGASAAIAAAIELSVRQRELPTGVTPCIAFEPYAMARTLANAITAHLSMGQVDKVMAYAGEIEDLVDRAGSRWTRALVGLDVATALVQQRSPDLEHAMALGRQALRLSGGAPIRSVWQRGHELHATAAGWQHEAVVREYAEELHGFTFRPGPEITPAPALPV